MQRAKLANQIVIANDQTARFAFELHILRLATKDGMFEDTVPRSYLSKAFDNCVRTDLAALADLDFIFDHGVWTRWGMLKEQQARRDITCAHVCAATG